MSSAELKTEFGKLVAYAKRLGIPEHLDPREIVTAAFVKALEKPISQRPSTANRKRVLAWLRTLVKFEIQTHRNSKHQKLLGEGHADEEIEALFPVFPAMGESLAAGEAWQTAMTTLGPRDRTLVVAHYEHGKTIQEIAREQRLPRSTVDSRLARIVQRLRKLIVSTGFLFVLLWTKKARVCMASLMHKVPQRLAQAMHTATIVAVPVVSGALLPTAASFRTDSAATTRLAWSTSGSSAPTLAGQVKPSTAKAVALVKPIDVDTGENPWFASDMNTNILRRFVAQAVVPAALVVAPAASSSACAGTAAQPPPEPERYDEFPDPYDNYCEEARARGETILTRKEFLRGMTVKGEPIE